MSGVLGYIPFLQPLPLDGYWVWLLIPLVAGVAVVYKTLRSERVEEAPRAAAYLTAQVLLFMALASAAMWAVAEWL